EKARPGERRQFAPEGSGRRDDDAAVRFRERNQAAATPPAAHLHRLVNFLQHQITISWLYISQRALKDVADATNSCSCQRTLILFCFRRAASHQARERPQAPSCSP